MTVASKRLIEIVAMPSSIGTLFANPAGKTSYVQQMIMYNGDGVDRIVEIHNVPDAAAAVGVAADANKFLEFSLKADETVFLDFGKPGVILVDENDTIQGLVASTTGKVTVQASGFQE